ncbi:MAG: hypothetical protein ACLFUJ_07675 [Phycisphaerae bacterium]
MRKTLGVAGLGILLSGTLTICLGCEKQPERANTDDELSAAETMDSSNADRSDPRALSEFFVRAVFDSPGAAHDLLSEDRKSATTKAEFRRSNRMVLPPGDTVTSIEFVKLEDGIGTMEVDGKTVPLLSYVYRVKSTDDFQPSCRVGVEVSKQGGLYSVQGFTVRSP